MTTTPTGELLDSHATSPAERLRAEYPDVVFLPGDERYERGRQAWNAAVDQRPAAVAEPRDSDDVVALVRSANRLGLRLAPQTTGHGASPLGDRDLTRAVLVRTSTMKGVSLDLRRKTARVQAGVLWQEVIEAVAEHGLTALHGSAPDIGVVGYSLGGGLGWYARKHGLATNSITAIELVTADGRLITADEWHHRKLFWALRGGGGNFGIVTALEFRLYPIADAYAGMMLWDIAHFESVLRTWNEWAATAPEEITTSLRVMRFPPLPELPPFLSGRSVVIVDGAVLADDATAAGQLAALRDLGPELDTFARVPSATLTRLHMDPEEPTPAVGNGIMLKHLDEAGIQALVEAVGPSAQTSLLMIDLRQLGGALARRARGAGALAEVPGAYMCYCVAMAVTPELADRGRQDAAALVQRLRPWSSGRTILNLMETRADPASGHDPRAFARLTKLRAQVDPQNRFLANHDF